MVLVDVREGDTLVLLRNDLAELLGERAVVTIAVDDNMSLILLFARGVLPTSEACQDDGAGVLGIRIQSVVGRTQCDSPSIDVTTSYAHTAARSAPP